MPTRGTRYWLQDLGWTVKKAYQPYFFNNNVGGYIEERDGLTFATVHGVGHMAPQWNRAGTYHLIFNWLLGRPI